MSKYRHFLVALSLVTLTSACVVTPRETLTTNELACSATDSQLKTVQQKLSACEELKLTQQQQLNRLQQQLKQERQQHQRLRQEHQDLQAKLDALTTIEQQLHQRRLEHSELP